MIWKKKTPTLLNAFNVENKFSDIKYKKNVGLEKIKRKSLTFEDAIIRLFLTETDILDIANKGKEAIEEHLKDTSVNKLLEQIIDYLDSDPEFKILVPAFNSIAETIKHPNKTSLS